MDVNGEIEIVFADPLVDAVQPESHILGDRLVRDRILVGQKRALGNKLLHELLLTLFPRENLLLVRLEIRSELRKPPLPVTTDDGFVPALRPKKIRELSRDNHIHIPFLYASVLSSAKIRLMSGHNENAQLPLRVRS